METGLNARIEQMNKARLGTDKGLVWGGAVFEPFYLSSAPRILFLLKESNCQTPNEVWGLPRHLRNQVEDIADGPLTSPRLYNIWKFIGCMAAGISGNMRSYQSIAGDRANFTSICKQGLSKTAVLNIKKTPGTSESDSRELLSYIQQTTHLELLLEEVNLLAPQIVICGGTYGLLAQTIKDKQETVWSTGAKTFTTKSSRAVFLEFVHPSIRGVKWNLPYIYLQCVYYDLMQAYGWSDR